MAEADSPGGLPAAASEALNRSRVAGLLLHDLGSPVGAILLYADILLGTDLAPYARERLERVRAAAVSCQDLAALLADVLAPAPPHPEALALPELVDAALRLAGARLRAAGLEVTLAAEPALPPVQADRPALLVLLLTLLAQEMAARAGPAPARLAVTAQAVGAGSGPVVRLRLEGGGAAAWAGRPLPPAETGFEWLGAVEAARKAGGRLALESSGGAAALVVEFPAAVRAPAERGGPPQSSIT